MRVWISCGAGLCVGPRTNEEVLGFNTHSAKDIMAQRSPGQLIEMFPLGP